MDVGTYFANIYKDIYSTAMWLLQQNYNFSLNNREIAFIILFLIFILWAFSQTNIRVALIDVLKALINKHFVHTYIEIILYTILTTTILYKVNFWDFNYIKDTIIWMLFSSLYLAYITADNRGNKQVFSNIISGLFKVSVIIEFLSNVYCFSIVAEFILISAILFLTMLITFIESKKENEQYRQVHGFLNAVLSVIGVYILVYIGYEIIKGWKELFTIEIVSEFLLPFIYSISFIPYLYYLTLRIIYDDIKFDIKQNSKAKKGLKFYLYFRLLILFYDRFRLFKIATSKRYLIRQFSNKSDIEEIIKNVDAL